MSCVVKEQFRFTHSPEVVYWVESEDINFFHTHFVVWSVCGALFI